MQQQHNAPVYDWPARKLPPIKTNAISPPASPTPRVQSPSTRRHGLKQRLILHTLAIVCLVFVVILSSLRSRSSQIDVGLDENMVDKDFGRFPATIGLKDSIWFSHSYILSETHKHWFNHNPRQPSDLRQYSRNIPIIAASSPDFIACPKVAPWDLNLPQLAKNLPYLSTDHSRDLDALLNTQARWLDAEAPNRLPVITLFFYGESDGAALKQLIKSNYKKNTIECGYIVVASSKKSLDTCLELNLPCFDATDLLLFITKHQTIQTEAAAALVQPIVTKAILQKGFAVHTTNVVKNKNDKDIASIKKMYLSLAATHSDAYTPMHPSQSPPAVFDFDTDNMLILPTIGGYHLASEWLEAAVLEINMTPGNDLGKHKKVAVPALSRLYQYNNVFDVCRNERQCVDVRAKGLRKKGVVVKGGSGSVQRPLVLYKPVLGEVDKPARNFELH